MVRADEEALAHGERLLLVALKQPATAEDVKAGRAIFHLGGKGQIADMKLPASGVIKKATDKDDDSGVLIFQTEVEPGGNTIYGVVGKRGIRAMPAKELRNVKPLEAKTTRKRE